MKGSNKSDSKSFSCEHIETNNTKKIQIKNSLSSNQFFKAIPDESDIDKNKNIKLVNKSKGLKLLKNKINSINKQINLNENEFECNIRKTVPVKSKSYNINNQKSYNKTEYLIYSKIIYKK